MRFPVAPLKHLSALPISNGVGEAAEFDDPTWPRYVRTTDIAGPRDLRPDTFKSLPPEVARRASLQHGDIVMTAAGATIGKSLLYGATDEACYAGYLVRFRPTKLVDGRFVAYWMESRHYWDQIATGKVVSTIENFSAGKYQNLSCPSPSAADQRAIADYLDTETARIDALIAKKQRMIELLDERLRTTIRHRLSNLEAPVLPLKRAWQVIDCKHRTPSYIDEPGFPVISPGDVSPGRLDLSVATRFVSLEDLEDLADGPRRPQRGDIIYSRNASIGTAAYVDTDERFCMGQDVCLITSTDQNQLFLSYVLNTVGLDQLDAQKIGSTFNRVNIAQIVELLVPIPNLPSQKALADEFDQRSASSQDAESKLRRQIELLREHRQALITAAVTGELEVPGVAA